RTGDRVPVDSNPMRILIVDDHPAFRRGIHEILDDEPDMEVVGEAADSDDAVQLIGELGPGGIDLLLMDIDLPKEDGLNATRRILADNPQLSVVILTVSSVDNDLFEAVRAGAVGFLSKSLAPEALVRALREFHQG